MGRKKNICYFCCFNGSTEADGLDGTECTSVLWTRCVIELIETTRFIASQLDREKNLFRVVVKGLKEKIYVYFCCFNEDTEADGHDSTKSTSVL